MKNRSILLISMATSTGTAGVSQAFLREYYMPLALLYLAGALDRHFEVRVLDLNTLKPWEMEPREAETRLLEEISRVLKEVNPFLVGLNCLFSAQIDLVVKAARLIKAEAPAVKVATGGIHPTIFSRQLLENVPALDFVIQGEGERSTVELALALAEGRRPGPIDGLTFRDHDGTVIDRPKTIFIDSPDDIPRPAYHLFDFKKYEIDTSRWHNPKGHRIGVPVPLITSRSCPQKCSFCVLFRAMGTRFRPRSAGHVLDEMEFLYHEYGTRYFEIMDDNFTLNKRRTLEICEGIVRRGLDVQIRTVNGLSINSLDQESVDALAEAGLVWAPIAVESGSDYIRNQVMGKNLSREKIFEVVAAFGRHQKIILTTFFIFGMPEDTPETLNETMAMMEELEVDDCSITNAIPFPGTRLHRQCLEENLFLGSAGGWNDQSLFATNQGQTFFIRPRAMNLEQLIALREQFDRLRLQKMSSKYRSISRTAWEAAALKTGTADRKII